MRTIQANNVILTYPDETCWLYDNLFVELVGDGVTVGAEIRVTELASGRYRTLTHISELERLVFPLNDTMKSLYRDAISFNAVVTVYEDGHETASFGFDFDCLNGKSLPMRAHGSTRTIYVYSQEDLYKVQMLFPASGALSVNGHSFPVLSPGMTGFDFRPYVTHSGTYSCCYQAGAKSGSASGINIVNAFGDTPFSGVVQLGFADESGEVPAGDKNKGDVWNDDKFSSERYCVNLVYEDVCAGFDVFSVMYTDTDGCIRYLSGKILEQTTNSSSKNFYRLDTGSVYRNISRKYREESSGTVKVAYDGLRRDSYWSDILLSDKVFFRNFDGTWLECGVVDKKVTVNADDSQDAQIEYELYID